MKKKITTQNAYSVSGVLSQAIDTGTLVFVSGQINITPDGNMVGDIVQEIYYKEFYDYGHFCLEDMGTTELPKLLDGCLS